MVVALLLLGCSAVDHACDLPTPEACWSDGTARLRDPAFDPSAAVQRFEQACHDGYQRACADLAVLLQDGRGLPRNTKRAVALDKAACASGLGVACSNLGMMYQLGTGGVNVDPEQADQAFASALAAYRASCTGPTPLYCSNLGWMVESGLGTPADPDQALAIWKQGCDGGDGESCVNRIIRQLEAGSDAPQAVAQLRENCANGVPSACGPLARALGPNEPEAAIASARHGCGQGDANACEVLGLLLTRSQPDQGRAAWDRACRLGLAEGCTAVFNLLLGSGSPSPAERDSALEHLGLACRIGDPQGCATLATLYHTGELGRTDPERARSYTVEACRMGLFDSCVELLRDGAELPLTPKLTAKFQADACGRGVTEACPPGAPPPSTGG